MAAPVAASTPKYTTDCSQSWYWVLVVSCAEPNGPVPKPLCPAERLICKFTSIAVEGHTFDTNSRARWI